MVYAEKFILIQEGQFVWQSGEQFTNPNTFVNWIDGEPSGDDCVLLDCNDGELVIIKVLKIGYSLMDFLVQMRKF